jgi:cardiolipin synthase A/B
MSTNELYPFVITGSYPTRASNSARLWIDGEPAFRGICEAIDNAQHSVWVTVTFMWPEFRMPNGRGTALDVLAQAAKRGVDVRVIFWRPDDETASWRRNAFWGTKEHFEMLQELESSINIRWDRAQLGFCQHQKTWLIDKQTAFVGGINLNPHSVASPGHVASPGQNGQSQNHDVYVEFSGPSVTDVQHNFVQRWNEASERHTDDGYWGDNVNLSFPTQLPAECGNVSIQIQRTIHAGRYQDGQAAVNRHAFDIASGEQSNFEQYLLAIRSARRTIYMENQYVEVQEVVEALQEALERGVEVVLLMPAVPVLSPTAYDSPEGKAFFEARSALGNYENFTLAGIAGLGLDGRRTPVYVHSKLMLIDDAWATIGSANLHRYSLFGNAELNAAMYSPEMVKSFRVALFEEHLGLDTSKLDDIAALRQFKQIAQMNHKKCLSNDHDWQGLAFSLDISTYGKTPQFG